MTDEENFKLKCTHIQQVLEGFAGLVLITLNLHGYLMSLGRQKIINKRHPSLSSCAGQAVQTVTKLLCEVVVVVVVVGG